MAKRKDLPYIDKQAQYKEVQQTLQEFANTKEVWYMTEFKDTWNKKHTPRIIEMVKLKDTIICKFDKGQTNIIANMRLG